MASIELLNRISREFERDYSVATQPDHPYLISAPDVLIGGNSRLTALFIPKKKEQGTPTAVLVRVAACRLALPSHTRFVLILDANNEALGNDYEISKSFDAVFFINLSKRRNMVELRQFILGQGRDMTPAGREVMAVQQRVFSRTTVLLQESQLNFAETRDVPARNPRDVLDSLSERRPYRPKSWSRSEQHPSGASYFLSGQHYLITSNQDFEPLSKRDQIVASRDSLVGAAVLPVGRSPMEKLGYFFSAGLQSGYTLDNGVPYLTDDNPKVLFVNISPNLKNDPQKPTRVMAFSGWVMAQVHVDEEVNNITQNIAERVRGRFK